MEDRRLLSHTLSFLILPVLLLLTSCHVARYVWWNYADIHDGTKFPAAAMSGSDMTMPLPPSTRPMKPVVPEAFRGGNESGFDEFIDSLRTVAFVVIRHDSLVYERYFRGYGKESALPSFSVAKSFVSALVGIALHDGKIQSVNQPVTDFLPEMADTGFRHVTIKNLLEMRSGIRFTEAYKSPFGAMPRFYYGLDLQKYTLDLQTETPPGITYNYQSANTELLALVLERATGESLSDYMEKKIWQPMGSQYPATWNTDSREHMQAKAFCCINARAVDFARFGQLYLHKGISGTDTVVPSVWVRESLDISTDSKDSQGFPYTYHWRVTKEGDFFAKGILGQYIYVCPETGTVIVRFGEKSMEFRWAAFFREVARQ